ncbi:hypothetical protein [Sphingobacterium endophyticum]|uniref:hypothetical protein n=1 Tax=Sphingobacterium endophyticum TaxID=2546448 RepID=UPI0012E204A5|nr:hypothetical protein [Sphingobacterium endophyticum]
MNNHSKVDSNVYIAELAVLDTLNEEYLLKWKIDFQYLSNEIPSELRAEIKESLDLEIIYKTDILGNFIGIENWEVLSGHVNNYLKRLTKMIAERLGQSNNIDQDMEKFYSALTSKESLEYLIYKEIPTLHSLYDISVPTSGSMEFENEGTTPFSKSPQKFKTKITLLDIDEYGLCSLKEETGLEQESMKKIMSDFLKENLPNIPEEKEFNEALKLIKLDISKVKTQSIDYNDGVIHFINYDTRVSIYLPEGNRTNYETIRIRLLSSSLDKTK